MDPATLKKTFKDAIIEALQEQRHELARPANHDELAKLLAEVFEDIGLGFAMKEVEDEVPVPYEEAMRVLRGKE